VWERGPMAMLGLFHAQRGRFLLARIGWRGSRREVRGRRGSGALVTCSLGFVVRFGVCGLGFRLRFRFSLRLRLGFRLGFRLCP
jgi:hypothetical protein